MRTRLKPPLVLSIAGRFVLSRISFCGIGEGWAKTPDNNELKQRDENVMSRAHQRAGSPSETRELLTYRLTCWINGAKLLHSGWDFRVAKIGYASKPMSCKQINEKLLWKGESENSKRDNKARHKTGVKEEISVSVRNRWTEWVYM